MRRDSDGVQFFDLVEVDWRSEHGPVVTAAANSGCTGGATEGTCTAVPNAGARVGGGRRGWRGDSTARAKRDGWTTEITSGRCEPDDEQRAWGIMVPES